MSDTFQVLSSANWQIDDKIMTRDPFLKFAGFDGEKFVGGLINNDQLSMSLGYKVLYTGTPGAVLEQTGLPKLPVENVMLRKGWNWIGHAPLSTYLIYEIAPVVGSFSADDQLKTRAGTSLKVGTCTGHISGLNGRATWSSSRRVLVTSSRCRRRSPSAMESFVGRPTSLALQLRQRSHDEQRADGLAIGASSRIEHDLLAP